jgi:CBS domain-containing protein
MTRVRDLLQNRREFFSVAAEATVHEAALFLRERGVRATVVCDAGHCPVGVISQSDISDKVAAEHRCPSWVKVREIMSVDLVTVTPDSPIEECLGLMEKHGIYHLVVVGSSGESLGMISAQDVLRVVASNEKARADLLQHWAFPPP